MALATPPRNVHPGDLLLVVHDFEARGPDELTLRRGEKIELVELDDGFGDGWYLGKDLDTGTQGLFPGVYTTVTPRIPIRPQKDSIGSNTLKTDIENVTGQELVASPVSGESTPQASRRASMSEMDSPNINNDSMVLTPSPKQQQRSSSSPLPTSKMAIDIQKAIRQSMDGHLHGQDSPVMNETLSVIDEHITDLSTPRHSVTTTQDSKTVNDSASEYSSTFEHRMSYINGHETDEEEEKQPTEEEVRGWNQSETAKRLRQLGIEAKHCDIFEEQEITGDVLLDMNQDFLFMKEFDFGVMGRRLKTWHKVKVFQDEVKGIQQRQPSRGSSFGAPQDERTPSRAGHTGPLFPRIPNLRASGGSAQHPRLISSTMQTSAGSPLPSQTPTWMDHSRRPSAASIREINHSRRHSSIDATNRHSGVGDSPASHHKKGSLDRGWTLSVVSGSQRRPGTAFGAPNETTLPQSFFYRTELNGSNSTTVVSDDLDRGYFSGPEGDTRKTRRVLQKRNSAHGSVSTPSSIPDEQFKLKVNKRHSRINSVDSIRDAVQNSPPATKASPPGGRFRSLSTRASERHRQQSSNSASVEEKTSSSGFFASFSLGSKTDQDQSHRSSPLPLQGIKNAGPKFRRAVGFRAMSEAVKGIDTSVSPASPGKDAESPSARTGSTTPSTTKSSDRHSTDGSGKAVESGASLPRARTLRSGTKSKKDTSAYTRGLEKKTPKVQMQGCDYSGWMKKKSSNLMTTWKPRLFVLHGRRLSYYYSEDDTEERGLIDITAHRVLRADNDPIITLHATLTGSTASPTSPPGSSVDGTSSDKASGSDASLRGSKTVGEGPFFFKLVPPKSGTSRTVQFTKPAIHYFQVDSVQEGRLWMAALMKATIERDMELPVETTNKQKTISLKEARLMNQRPPTLMATPATQGTEDTDEQATTATTTEQGSGLMIQGLGDDQVPTHGDDVEENQASSPLSGVDVGRSSLLPESVAKIH